MVILSTTTDNQSPTFLSSKHHASTWCYFLICSLHLPVREKCAYVHLIGEETEVQSGGDFLEAL